MQQQAVDETGQQEQEPQEGEGRDEPPAAARRGGFGFDDADEGTSEAAPSAAVGGFGVDNIPRPPPDASIDTSGSTKFQGVSRRKQDQRVREEEEKERVQSKYDDLADKAAPIDSIMEIEEEGKEDMSNMVRAWGACAWVGSCAWGSGPFKRAVASLVCWACMASSLGTLLGREDESYISFGHVQLRKQRGLGRGHIRAVTSMQLLPLICADG
jgi:hypothetical protein